MQQAASFPTSGGRTVYSVPVTAFPGLVANIYLVDNGDELILVDVPLEFEPVGIWASQGG